MSLPHALLTALMDKPSSGSDLAQRFDRSLGYFWHATHQQIYRELTRMAQAGWIASLPAESGRGRKRAYEILPSGRDELARWLSESFDPEPLRNELMVRLRAHAALSAQENDAAHASAQELTAQLQRHLQLHEAQWALYQQFDARGFNNAAKTKPVQEQAIKQLVLTAGIHYEAFWIDFCQRALAILNPSSSSQSSESPS